MLFTHQLAALALSTLALAGCGGDDAADPSTQQLSSAPGLAAAPQSVGDDPDAVAQAGTADPAKGVKGTVKDVDGKPLAGITVSVVSDGGKREVTTGGDGKYNFRKLPAGDAVLRFSKDGWIPQLISYYIWTDEDLTIDAEMYEEASEVAEFKDTHGKDWDRSKGVVFVQFESREDAKNVLYGGGATLDARGAVGKVITSDDKVVPGTIVPDKSASPSVEFIDVPAGQWPVTVTPPPGLDCFVPAQVRVAAGGYSTLFASCEPPTP